MWTAPLVRVRHCTGPVHYPFVWQRLLVVVGVVVLICVDSVCGSAGHDEKLVPWALGDEITVECKSSLSDNVWVPGITCQENQKPLRVVYGKDSFIYCGWALSDESIYKFAVSVINQESAWQCRIPMSKDKKFYVPFALPLWGIVEATHLHLNYHMNFIFHADAGIIMGVSVYPVRDGFQFLTLKTIFNIHGPVRWFHAHSFSPINAPHPHTGYSSSHSHDGASESGCSWLSVCAWMILSGMISTAIWATYYVNNLKPKLIKKYLKGD